MLSCDLCGSKLQSLEACCKHTLLLLLLPLFLLLLFLPIPTAMHSPNASPPLRRLSVRVEPCVPVKGKVF